MKQEDEHIMYMDDDYTFKFIFLLKTTPDEWLEKYIDKNPEFKLLIDKIKRTTEVSFTDLFEYHFKLWETELQNKNDDLIKYINLEIKRAVKEINPISDFENKIIILASKWTKLYSKNYTSPRTEIVLKYNQFTNVLITQKSIFHIIWSHYLRFPAIKLKDRNKSIFFDHKELVFINMIEYFTKELSNQYDLIKKTEVFKIKYNSKFYTLVLSKINQDYEVTTFYIIDREVDIAILTKINSLENIEIYE